MRLDKYISDNTPYSRTEAKSLIKSGRIRINSNPAQSAAQQLKDEVVFLDDKEIVPVGDIYIAMNKPAGYVCANTDAEHPTVMDLISERSRFIGSDTDFLRIKASKLQIVGRLDLDTTGLLLLTNDGAWNHQITSPNSRCEKTYVAELAEPLSETLVERFAEGILLRDKNTPTQPAKLEILDSHKAKITVSEGRYHQIKRMFGACNNLVINLHRARIGALELDSTLSEGNFRLLSKEETV